MTCIYCPKRNLMPVLFSMNLAWVVFISVRSAVADLCQTTVSTHNSTQNGFKNAHKFTPESNFYHIPMPLCPVTVFPNLIVSFHYTVLALCARATLVFR